jgi:hypothetical protein
LLLDVFSASFPALISTVLASTTIPAIWASLGAADYATALVLATAKVKATAANAMFFIECLLVMRSGMNAMQNRMLGHALVVVYFYHENDTRALPPQHSVRSQIAFVAFLHGLNYVANYQAR